MDTDGYMTTRESPKKTWTHQLFSNLIILMPYVCVIMKHAVKVFTHLTFV